MWIESWRTPWVASLVLVGNMILAGARLAAEHAPKVFPQRGARAERFLEAEPAARFRTYPFPIRRRGTR